MRALAHAKLNLHLEILGRRPDGYHELVSLFQTIDLHDRLELRTSEGPLRLRVHPAGAAVGAGPDNLVLRALESLRAAFKVRQGAAARLWKRIPVGAGLGGGSADAAAALLAGVRLWRLDASSARLRALAAKLGADVPYFLRGGAAWMGGRGDRVLSRGTLPDFLAVVVYPGFQVSSREAFEALEIPLTRRFRKPSVNHYSWAACAGTKLVYNGTNAFEPMLLSRFSPMAVIQRELAASGACGIRVTGSGSAIFGVVPDLRTARALHLRVRRAGHECWIVRPVQYGVEFPGPGTD